MGILNDYRCAGCGATGERWTESPAPSSLTCQFCGAEAKRLLAAARLGGLAPKPTASSPAPKPSMCSRYPMVPGLCHMSEDAGRMWVAKYKGDDRAIDRESERQESMAKEKPFVLEDAISHHHHHEPAAPQAQSTA
ncbi:MAG TPA: hypothetical protein DCQ36_10880 [Actinobacteria bacterium]|jgi:hypothetical protein|nr:hypothetical protein [Actinomycetota bacterium]